MNKEYESDPEEIEEESEDDDYEEDDKDEEEDDQDDDEPSPPPAKKKVKSSEPPKTTRAKKTEEPKPKEEEKPKGRSRGARGAGTQPQPAKKSPEPKAPKQQPKPKEAKEKKPKEPKEPKEKKKTKKEEKAEEKAAQLKLQELEDQKYFINQITEENSKKAQSELSQIAEESIANNHLSLEKLKGVIEKYELAHPKENIDLLIRRFQEDFQHKGASASLCFELFNFASSHLFAPIPCIQQTMFFPNRENELRLASVLRKARKTLDICVFALTNDRLRDAILHAFENGAKVRVITDDECSKFPGADVFLLGVQGIPCTMDKNEKVHMHNKFAIIDRLVLVTGSFNWTTQAVQQNQENLIVIENQRLISDYQAEFEKLWEQFSGNRLSVEQCQQKVKEAEERSKANIAKMAEGRKQKQAEKKKE